MKNITFEEWMEEYNPIENHFNEEEGAYDNKMFETYGEELDYILNYPEKNKIWTLTGGDNESEYILPGYSIVNRQGYFITEKPWEYEDIEVDLNEYIPIKEAIKYSEEFINDVVNKEFDKTLLDNYMRANSDNRRITIGEAKYKLIDFLEDELSVNITSFEDEIHNYFSELI